MKHLWKSELFSLRAAALCCVGGVMVFCILRWITSEGADSWHFAVQIGLISCHGLLVARSLRYRQRWSLDLSSYLDLMCLVGGFLVAPAYCILKARHQELVAKSSTDERRTK